MKKSNVEKSKVKCILSTTALTGLMTVALSSTAFAKTTAVLTKDSNGKLYQYNYQDLIDSIMGDQDLYKQFKANGDIDSYYDDKAGYVDFNYIKDRFNSMDKKYFRIDTITEAAAGTSHIKKYSDTIFPVVVNSDGTINYGSPVYFIPVPTTISVNNVSVEEGKTAVPVVTVKNQNGDVMTSGYNLNYYMTSGSSTVNPTTGIINAANYSYATNGNINTLYVTATSTTGTSIAQTATVTVTQDVTKPTIESVQAINSRQIKVEYSEKVDKATAEDVTNYKLQPASSVPIPYSLVKTGYGGIGKVEAVASLQADGKTVLISILNTSYNLGFVNNRLIDSYYMLYVSNIKDTATMPNVIVNNSSEEFLGTTQADTTAPSLLSVGYDNGLKQLKLSFDEKVSNITLSDITITNGSAQVVLTGATLDPSLPTATPIITLSSQQAAALGTMQSNAIVQFYPGAFSDASGNANTSVITSGINQTLRPEITSSTYYEDYQGANKLFINFNEAIKTTKDFLRKVKIQYSTDGTNYNDLITNLDDTNYTLDTTLSSSNSLVYNLSETAVAAMGKQRSTSGVTYKIAFQDGAVTNLDGTLSNDVGLPGGNDYQYVYLSYNKETSIPKIQSANFYVADKSSTPRYSGDTTGVEANHLYIKFDHKMSTSIKNSKLKLKYGASNDTEISGTLLNDGQTLDITLSGNSSAIAQGTATVKVESGTSLTDVNGNAVAPQSQTITYNNNANAGSVSAAMYSATQIKLTQPTTNFGGTISTDNFTVKDGSSIKTIKNVKMIDTNGDGVKDAIFIELSSAPTSVSSLKVSYTGLKDQFGQSIADATVSIGSAVSDSISPKLVKSSTYTDVDNSCSISKGDKITLTFDEPVKATGKDLDEDAYGKDSTLSYGNSGNEMVITLGTFKDDKPSNIVFGTTKLQGDIIEDVSGNYYNGSDEIPTPAGAKAPVINSTVGITAVDKDSDGAFSANDQIIIPFDKNLKANDINKTNIMLTHSNSNKTEIAKGTTFTAKVDGSNIILTFDKVDYSDAVGATDLLVTIKSGSKIQNPWGVEAGECTNTITGSTSSKPYITSARFDKNSNELSVTFSEAVNLTNINNAVLSDLFSVTGESDLGSLAGARFGTDHKTVIFTLNSPFIVSGTYLNVEAGGASSDAIKDFDGNKLIRNDNTGVLIQ